MLEHAVNAVLNLLYDRPIIRIHRFIGGECAQTRVPGFGKDGGLILTGYIGPEFIGGKAQDGRNPAHHRLQYMVHSGLRRTAGQGIFLRGVEPILDDIEVESAHIQGTEMVNFLHHLNKLIVVVQVRQFGLHTQRSIDRPTIQGQQVVDAQGVSSRFKAIQIRHQKAGGITDAPVGI